MPRPARPWFRFYSEQLESRKAQDLRHSDPVLYGIWIQLLCIANLSPVRGTLPSIENITFALRPDPADEIGQGVERLIALRFIDRKGVRLLMHQWADWQKDSDARATEGRRMRGGSAADAPQNGGGSAADAPRREEKKRSEIRKRSETEKTRDPGPLDDVVSDFAKIGLCNERTVDLIEEAVEHHGFLAVQAAIDTAAGSGKTDLPWNYIVSILEGKNDFNTGRPNGTSTTRRPAATTGHNAADAERELYANLLKEPPITL